jgi:hypothetical protein
MQRSGFIDEREHFRSSSERANTNRTFVRDRIRIFSLSGSRNCGRARTRGQPCQWTVGCGRPCEPDKHSPSSLFRLLRALESIGLFQQVSPRTFANTPMSDLLRKDVPGSDWAHIRGLSPGNGFYEAWSGFTDTIRTGKTAFHEIHGCKIWEYLQSNPKPASIFDLAMRSV